MKKFYKDFPFVFWLWAFAIVTTNIHLISDCFISPSWAVIGYTFLRMSISTIPFLLWLCMFLYLKKRYMPDDSEDEAVSTTRNKRPS